MSGSLINRPVRKIKIDRVQGSGFRVQHSGRVIANCRLQIANCKLPGAQSSSLAPLPDHYVVPGKSHCRNRHSTFSIQHSAFDFHPSSLIPHPSSFRLKPPASGLKPKAYTLVEILVAMTITLILLGAVVQMFAKVGESITESRSFLEASERLRSAAARLQMDLQGVTVTMLPPRNPEAGEGYFEYIEGPVTQYIILQWAQALPGPTVIPRPINSELTGNNTDTSVGDFDDILMFTTQSTGKPFVGMFFPNGGATVQNVQSDVAEVAWFIRGRTLHRRQLLVAPGLWNIFNSINDYPLAKGFYEKNDISVWSIDINNDPTNPDWRAIPNTLSDLTRRECRFAHPNNINFPFNVSFAWGQLGLPTLKECSDPDWYCDGRWISTMIPLPFSNVDFWSNSGPYAPYKDSEIIDPSDGTPYSGTRIADDVILTNVIGFDVTAWDPGAKRDPVNNISMGDYVNLGNGDITNNPTPPAFFTDYGVAKSMLRGDVNTARVYDTWSTHYENIGLEGYSNSTKPNEQAAYPPGRGVNGFDDVIVILNPDGSVQQINPNGIVDDEVEQLTSPPYPVPLRGIQVKIRIFEPDSRQIRELTVVQDFPPK